MTKRLAILGSTGSIGTQTLSAIEAFPGEFEIVALAANRASDLLLAQVELYKPKYVGIFSEDEAMKCPGALAGMEGLCEIAGLDEVDMVVMAVAGSVALLPTISAIRAGKEIAFATKEVLVMGGELVMQELERSSATLIPVDSEHSSLFQLIEGCDEEIKSYTLTASGGPFRTWPTFQLGKISIDEALNHPSWSMGKKVTIDSSTLMNKGFEVIEAHYLFNLPIDRIDVVIHPQSLVHAMIKMADGSQFTHMANPNMLMPIQYALTYPHRREFPLRPIDFSGGITMEFETPDRKKFPCLDFAYGAIREGGSVPCYLNGANEALVGAFLEKRVGWLEMVRTLGNLMEKHKKVSALDLDVLRDVDAQARLDVEEAIG